MLEAQPRGTRSGTQRDPARGSLETIPREENGRLASQALKIASPAPTTTLKPTRAGCGTPLPVRQTFGGNLAALPGVCGVTTDPSIPGPPAASSPPPAASRFPGSGMEAPATALFPGEGRSGGGCRSEGARGAPKCRRLQGTGVKGTGRALHSARPRERREAGKSAGRHLRSPGSRRGFAAGPGPPRGPGAQPTGEGDRPIRAAPYLRPP